MKNMHYHIFNLICCLSVIFSGCTDSQGPTSGNGSDVGNGAVAGKVYNPGGSPAVNATVKVITVDHNPQPGLQENISITDSTITDKNGNYSIDSLSKGQYNILYSGDSGVAFNDSVYIDGDSITEELSDTLKDPGSIYGVVRLQPDHNSKTIFILVFGTNTFTVPMDSIGNFSLTGMAEGEYNVTIITTIPDYNTLDTSFNIISGKNDTLSDTIRLDYHGIPVPTGLHIDYDTMKQIVTLTWDKADTSLVSGYNVYRRHSDSSFSNIPINTLLVTDTVYNDSTALQDQFYEYKIKSVDKDGDEGMISMGVGVPIVSGFTLVATYGNGQGSRDGQFNGLVGISVDGYGNVYCVDVGNHRIHKFDEEGNFLLTWGSQGSDIGQFYSPKDIAVDSLGNVYIADTKNHRIQKFSDDGIFILQWGKKGSEYGQFQNPYSIAISIGAIYVGDWQGQRIQKFDLEGNFLLSIDVGGPISAVAASDSIIFAIVNDKRVFKFSAQGEFIDTIYVTGKMSDGISDIQIYSLSILFGSNILYMSNLSERKIQAIDFAGLNILQFYLNRFNEDTPQDVFVTYDGAIFVARYGGYFQKYVLK